MSPDPLIILLLKIGIPLGFAALIQWVAAYSWQERWWRHQLGWSLVAKTLLVAGLLMLTGLSIFFHLTRADSYAVAWTEVVLIFSITPVMIWRTIVWTRLSRMARKIDREQDAAGTSIQESAGKRQDA